MKINSEKFNINSLYFAEIREVVDFKANNLGHHYITSAYHDYTITFPIKHFSHRSIKYNRADISRLKAKCYFGLEINDLFINKKLKLKRCLPKEWQKKYYTIEEIEKLDTPEMHKIIIENIEQKKITNKAKQLVKKLVN